MQPRGIREVAVRRLEGLGLQRVHAYQPQHLFVPNGRKLTRVAEPSDPWLVFATDGDRTLSAVAATPKEAASEITLAVTLPALANLGIEIAKLTEAVRGKRPRS